jgi:putative glutamine amidotransferase
MSAQDRRPIIGVPTQTLQSLGGISTDIPPSWVMSQRYVLAMTEAGAAPFLIPLVDNEALRALYESLDAVFLPGGADIDPKSYGDNPHPLCDKTDMERDCVELMLAKWAMEDGKPTLGVCRGMQIINLAAGGTLYQDLKDQFEGSIKHDYYPYGEQRFDRDYLAHDVLVEPGARLSRFLGSGSVMVNSMHHQGIRTLGSGIRATAVASDGLIEAIEGSNGSYLLGVQWHPEALTARDDATRALFEDFVAVAREAAKRA